MTSERSTVPLADMSKLMLSMMSKNTSFFLYRIPSRRCPTAPVTCIVVMLLWLVAFHCTRKAVGTPATYVSVTASTTQITDLVKTLTRITCLV